MRFKEDVLFLAEEQKRVLITQEKTASEWSLRAQVPPELSTCPVLTQGLTAYARKQAAFNAALGAKFKDMWKLGTSERQVDPEDQPDEEDDSHVRFAVAGNESDDEVTDAHGHDSEYE